MKHFLSMLSYIYTIIDPLWGDSFDIATLLEADSILLSREKAQIASLARKVKEALYNIRFELREYSKNIFILDPNIAYNKNLSALLVDLSSIW